MRFETALNGGRVAAARVIEVRTVPHIEAGDAGSSEFRRLTAGLDAMLSECSQRFCDGSFSFELLMLSLPVEHQLYRGQPRVFVILRKFGADARSMATDLNEMARDVSARLAGLGYSCVLIDGSDASSAEDFEQTLRAVRHDRVVTVSREEKILAAPMGGVLYYNEPVVTNTQLNLGTLTDELSGRPGSAYSIQLIPTTYTVQERQAVERSRMVVDAMRKQVMMTPQSVTPTAFIEASRAYLDFIDHENELAFYTMPVIYGAPQDVQSLYGRLMTLFSPPGGDTHMLVPVAVDGDIPPLSESFLVKPWTMSDLLVTCKRNMRFWNQAKVPRSLIRCRQLLPMSIVSALIHPPFDDGTTIGLEVTRGGASKERLDASVMDERSFRVGRIIDPAYVDSGDGTPLQAGIPLNNLTKHGMIVGKSGSGKTNFIHTMLLRLARRGIPFLAIEPTKSEYRCLTDAIDDLTVFTPGMNTVSPFIINPFVPPIGVTVESYIPSLMNAFQAAFTMPDPLPAIFQEVVNKTYAKYGWKRTSTCEDPDVTWFGFHEMILEFQNHVASMDYQGEVRGNITTAGVLRLSTLIEQNPDIYDTTPTIPIHELLKRPVVLELNAITSPEQKTLLMALLLISICLYTKFNTALDGELKNLLFIDEAHVLFGTSEEDGGNRAVRELENMIAEIRAYGTGVFLGDQSATTFGDSIMANTDTKIMFQIVERRNKQVLADATGMDEEKTDLLSRLHVGECLLYYGRLPEPILVKADDARSLASFRRGVSNEEIRGRDTFWKEHRDLLMPFAVCRSCRSCVLHGCDLQGRVLANYIAMNMSYFYRDHIKDKETLERFIRTKAERNVAAKLDRNNVRENRERMGFCVTTRLLRYLQRACKLGTGTRDNARYVREYSDFVYDSIRPDGNRSRPGKIG